MRAAVYLAASFAVVVVTGVLIEGIRAHREWRAWKALRR
jgi:hypothetical protein